MELVPGSVFELAELQHMLAREWDLARTRATLVASGHGLSIDPLETRQNRKFSSHPEWTRLHLQGGELAGDLRCSPHDLPFENNSLQLIVARHIGDALEPGSGIEAELARILAPGGVLFMFGLNPLSPWRLWWSRQARHGRRLPGCRSAGRMRRTLEDGHLSIAREEYFGGAWPKAEPDEWPAELRPSAAMWQGAWLLAAHKQRLGMHPIPLRSGRQRVTLNHGLVQSPSRRVSQ